MACFSRESPQLNSHNHSDSPGLFMRRSSLSETTLGFIFSWNAEFVKFKFIKLDLKRSRLSCDIINHQSWAVYKQRVAVEKPSGIKDRAFSRHLIFTFCMVYGIYLYIWHVATQTWFKGVQNCLVKMKWIVVEGSWTSDGSESGVFVQAMIREYSLIIGSRRSDILLKDIQNSFVVLQS